jgi:pimeloyl-ACP methyl ester carboxylesterase
MPRKKSRPKPEARPPASVPASASSQRKESLRSPSSPPPTVSGRWLLTTVSLSLLGAAACAWGALCLLFWQGSWQLLYHPTSAVTRTPATVGLRFDSVGFAATDAGEPRLEGWWIPAGPEARFSSYTILYFHGQNGNLGDTVDSLAALHGAGLNVFAFDYRGYGQSQFARPSEARWREDAESAIEYLTNTRHIPAGSIVLFGRGLGANLALETASAHPQLAGVVMDDPLPVPVDAIFRDPRARLVPALLLVRDRWDLNPPAVNLRIPSLWFYKTPARGQAQENGQQTYRLVTARKRQVWLMESPDAGAAENDRSYSLALTGWLDDLSTRTGTP